MVQCYYIPRVHKRTSVYVLEKADFCQTMKPKANSSSVTTNIPNAHPKLCSCTKTSHLWIITAASQLKHSFAHSVMCASIFKNFEKSPPNYNSRFIHVLLFNIKNEYMNGFLLNQFLGKDLQGENLTEHNYLLRYLQSYYSSPGLFTTFK